MSKATLWDDGDGLLDEMTTPKPRMTAQQEYRRGILAKLGAGRDIECAGIPEFRGEKRIILNAETNGLQWYGKDRPIGWSYLLPESKRMGYLPIRHEGGGNLPVEQVHAFLDSIHDTKIENINMKFDGHMSRVDGVDLMADSKHNRFGDVAFHAGLLDDQRRRYKLDLLSKEIIGWDVDADGLGPIPKEITSELEFQYLHANRVAPYAVRNVQQVALLLDALNPKIHEEELDECMALEEDVLPVVVEMEKNGAYLDMDLLHKWQRQAHDDYDNTLHKIYRDTGCHIDSPDSAKDLERLFNVLKLPITRTATGNPSFTADILKHIDHPTVKDITRAGHLADLNSKYLDKYAKTARPDGWIRFQLHQLRAASDAFSDDGKGTVSGRFSAAGDRDGGFNPQQVVAVEKQLERGWLPEYLVRQLFIAGPETRARGGCLAAADMMQVEYRLFAHDAQIHAAFHARPMRKMINGKWVWVQGPLADFHSLVAELLNNPLLNRKLVKNVNFAMIYGAGLIKFALMLGYITAVQFALFTTRMRARDWSVLNEPELAQAKHVREEYFKMFPSVPALLKAAGDAVRERGYIRDLIGRRARPIGREHSALNRRIQGGAATYNKRVLVELYKRRVELMLTLRLTVHDEVVTDLAEKRGVYSFKKLLNKQYFPQLRAPILWDVHTGDNWAACK